MHKFISLPLPLLLVFLFCFGVAKSQESLILVEVPSQEEDSQHIQHVKSKQIPSSYIHQNPPLYLDFHSQTYEKLPFCVIQQEQDEQYNSQLNLIPIPLSDIFTLSQLKEVIDDACPPYSVILFFSGETSAEETVIKLNKIFQSRNAWATFTSEAGQGSEKLYVNSLYKRIFDLLFLNDFTNLNVERIGGDWGLLATAIFQLSQSHIYNSTEETDILRNTLQMSLPFAKEVNYQPLLKLNQEYLINETDLQSRYKKLLAKNFSMAISDQSIDLKKTLKAQEYENLLYLPTEHWLGSREIQEYNQRYQTSRFNKEELAMCVTVMSHNNVENNRYEQIMLSILTQNYSNYHIVFIDDHSEDGTLQETRRLLQMWGFPQERVTLLRNNGRKFATYNIVHAAFSYCDRQSIQLLVDGDDVLIGRQAFRLINGIYQRYSNAWVVYTNFHSSLYTTGTSKPIRSDDYLLRKGQRLRRHYIGPIRSWKVELMRKIPLQYHQFENGTWLDTLYDDALQHSLFQMSGSKRIRYIPEICYLYNKNYGDNDDSSSEKKQHRRDTYKQRVATMAPLPRLKSLENSEDASEIMQLFEKEETENQFTELPLY